MGVARRPGEAGGEAQVADDVVVRINEEFEAEAGAIFKSAAESSG
jgi:hypothetical protein